MHLNREQVRDSVAGVALAGLTYFAIRHGALDFLGSTATLVHDAQETVASHGNPAVEAATYTQEVVTLREMALAVATYSGYVIFNRLPLYFGDQES